MLLDQTVSVSKHAHQDVAHLKSNDCNNKTHKICAINTHVPSSSSTATPASHPLIKASSPSPSNNNAYLNDEISHANAARSVVWFVCDRSVEERALLDNDDVQWFWNKVLSLLLMWALGIRNGDGVCCGDVDEGEHRRGMSRITVLLARPFIFCLRC